MPFGEQFNNKDMNYITDIAYAFRKSRTLFSGLDLSVFTALGDRTKTAEQVAEEIKVDKRGLTRLLDGLVSINLLKKNQQVYSNTEISRRYLSKDSPDYAGHIAHVSDVWDLWSELSKSVISGEPGRYQDFADKDEEWMKNYATSMHWQAQSEADEIINTLSLRHVNNVLDLGGCSGYYSQRLLARNPHLNITLYDHPRLMKYAKEYLESEGSLDKIRLMSGDFFENDFGQEKEYDLVIVSHSLSEYSIIDNIALLTKVFHFLDFGGKVVINETILEDSRTKPEQLALESLGLLVKTRKGELFTNTDVWVMLRESMFLDIDVVKYAEGKQIMIGNK